MANYTGRKLPIHILEDIKKHGEALALKEKELLESRQIIRNLNNTIESDSGRLQSLKEQLEQNEHELKRIRSDNIIREHIEIKAVSDQSKYIDEQAEQLKLDISKILQSIKEDENIYDEKCKDLSMNHGLLSKHKLEKRKSEIKEESEALQNQKFSLLADINSIKEKLEEKRILVTEVESTRSFSKLFQDDISSTAQNIAEIQEDIKYLTFKRDTMKNEDHDEELLKMQEKANYLKKKLQERRSSICEPVNSSSIDDEYSKHTLSDERITDPKNASRKFKFMPYQLNQS